MAMACLLALVIAATVLTAPPGKLTHAARATSPAETFWRTALPGAPMPEAIHELLHPRAEASVPNDVKVHVDGSDDDPPPPMNFNYDDYKAASPSRRNQVSAAEAALSSEASKHVSGTRKGWNAATDDDDARASPAVFFLEDAVRVGFSLPFGRSSVPRAADDDDEAPALALLAPLQLYTVRAVRAVEGSSFVVCRREAPGAGAAAVYGCRGAGPARAYAVDVVAERGDDAATATVVCRTDTSGSNLEHAAFRLLGVKPGGVAVCYAVPANAQILPAKSEDAEEVPSSAKG